MGTAQREGQGEAAAQVFTLNRDGEPVALERWLAAHTGDRWMPGALLLVKEWTVLATAIRVPEFKFSPVGTQPRAALDPVEGEPAPADSFQHNKERAQALLRLFLARMSPDDSDLNPIRGAIAMAIETSPEPVSQMLEKASVAWREAKIQLQLS